MAAPILFTDIYLRTDDNKKASKVSIVEDDLVKVIIQKYEMILMTNKRDLYGDPDFGADLLDLLYNTVVDASVVEEKIVSQIVAYIPELVEIPYSLKVEFATDVDNYQDLVFVYFTVGSYDVFTYASAYESNSRLTPTI
jgi:hypothetical protein